MSPLKSHSIPRLELQAALVGARLADSIIKESQIKFDRKFYKSDSRTVLCWIRSDPRFYKIFVANRLGEIDELTISPSWRWVSSEKNPADAATKIKKLDLGPDSLWQKGLDFLSKPEPQPLNTKEDFETGEEAKSVFLVRKRDSCLSDPSRFSK